MSARCRPNHVRNDTKQHLAGVELRTNSATPSWLYHSFIDTFDILVSSHHPPSFATDSCRRPASLPLPQPTSVHVPVHRRCLALRSTHAFTQARHETGSKARGLRCGILPANYRPGRAIGLCLEGLIPQSDLGLDDAAMADQLDDSAEIPDPVLDEPLSAPDIEVPAADPADLPDDAGVTDFGEGGTRGSSGLSVYESEHTPQPVPGLGNPRCVIAGPQVARREHADCPCPSFLELTNILQVSNCRLQKPNWGYHTRA